MFFFGSDQKATSYHRFWHRKEKESSPDTSVEEPNIDMEPRDGTQQNPNPISSSSPADDNHNDMGNCNGSCNKKRYKKSKGSGDKKERFKSAWVKINEVVGRDTFTGSLFYNFWAFLLPNLYEIFSRLLVGDLHPEKISTTNTYGYLNALSLVLNEGLPRVAWTIIGDDTTRTPYSRISLSYTLITFQVFFGMLISGILMASAGKTAASVKDGGESASLAYVRYTSLLAFSSAIEVSVSNCARALDHPEIPFYVSICKFVLNLILDVTIMSQFHTLLHKPSMVNQAITQMVCNLVSATVGLCCFVAIIRGFLKNDKEKSRARPCYSSLKTLATHGFWTLTESALRQSVSMWLMNGLVAAMGPDNFIAWTTFNTIRSGILTVPLKALEASTLTFIGHAWGEWRGNRPKKTELGESKTESEEGKKTAVITGLGPLDDTELIDNSTSENRAQKSTPKISEENFTEIVNIAWLPCLAVTALEIGFFVTFSIWGATHFGYFLTASKSIGGMVRWMWRTIDWTYTLSSLSTILAAILLATTPRYYCLQGVLTTILWTLAWAIAVPGYNWNQNQAWHMTAIVNGGQQLFNFLSVGFVCLLWRYYLMRGKLKLLEVKSEM